jgi:hypothetical protein
MPPRGSQPRTSCRIWDLWANNPGDSFVMLPHLPEGVDRIAISGNDQWLFTASRDGVRVWPLGISNDGLKLTGGFYHDRFVRLEYFNSEGRRMQFGCATLELDAPGDKMEGEYVGYGAWSEAVISGTISVVREKNRGNLGGR